MKKIKFIISIVVITCFTACINNENSKKADSNIFEIKGEIEGLGNNTLYYRHPAKDYQELGYWMDSIVVKDGKFEYTDSIEGHHFFLIYTEVKKLKKVAKSGGFYPARSSWLNLMIYPGADINIAGNINADFMDAYATDGGVNDDFAKLHKEVFPLMNEAVNYSVEASFAEEENAKNELVKKGNEIASKVYAIKKDFIMANPKSMASVYYLSNMMMRDEITPEDAITAFNSLDASFSEVSYYKDAAQRVTAINSTKIGTEAPSIKTNSTLDGLEFDLNSLKGKYVMIDFWGIWCGPCVGEMPKVKEYAEKYAEKLAILGVNSGDDKQRIIDFVNRNNYEWQQIMDVKDSDTDNFVLKYNINGFPTKFILDPNGKIVNKFVGSGEEAFELLDELLK